MLIRVTILILLILLCLRLCAQNERITPSQAITTKYELIFTSLDSLLAYTHPKSTILKSGEIRFTQAQKAKLAAVASVLDLSGNVGLNITNNTKLPVSVFPAEIFNGPPGTYREVRTGIQYTNNFSQYAEVKLLNPSGWMNIYIAKLNIQATSLDNKISLKSLQENIAIAYFNIIALNAQLNSAHENMNTADTLLQIVRTKYRAGIARAQDVNEAEVNFLTSKESYTQIQYLLSQQYISLKILCDIPESETVVIRQSVIPMQSTSSPAITTHKISLMSAAVKERSALTLYRQQKANLLPTVSAFAANSYQQFNNKFSLFDKNVNWINSNYIGVKAVLLIPSAANISQLSKTKYELQLAKTNTEHERLKSQFEYSQLSIDYEKARSQMQTDKMTYDLRKDSYEKSLENYKQGLISLDKLLSSYNNMVASEYGYASSVSSLLLADAKIKINNTIQ